MGILHSSKAYVFNLHATSSAEAKDYGEEM